MSKKKQNQKISIIIPTKDKGSYLSACLEAIEKNTDYDNYEVIIMDNESSEEEALTVLKNTKHKVISYPHKFNFSKINNEGAKIASGEYLVFLNNDAVPHRGWLITMLDECKKQGVGIVGSQLLFPDSTIQHAGMTINNNFRGIHDFLKESSDSSQVNVVRECDAVTGACMMISKDLFLELNGFDEEYWVECQDVDLCLKARNKGLKVIYAPKSVLIHHEMITRGPVKAEEEIHDTAVLKRKWFEKQGDNAIK